MKSANFFAILFFGASIYAAGSAFAEQASRAGTLVQRDFSDCSNSDISVHDPLVGGAVSVDRGTDGNTHVRVSLRARPNTTYHFFLKCVRLLGDITTQGDGFAVANFDFPLNSVGDIFAFDMYPEGAPAGDKFQSVQINFRDVPTENSFVTSLPPDQKISRETLLVKQDFSDCSNANVSAKDGPLMIGGSASVDRGTGGNTHVRVSLRARPNTTYHFFLKCVRLLGDITTQANGVGLANFNFQTNLTGDVFAFDMYPEGAPLGDKFQGVQVDFRLPPPPPQPPQPPQPQPPVGVSARIEYVSQTGKSISIAYENMPVGTEIVLLDGTSGTDTRSRTALSQSAGFLDFAIDPSQGPGDYYLLARKQADKEYLAQTIRFYIN